MKLTRRKVIVGTSVIVGSCVVGTAGLAIIGPRINEFVTDTDVDNVEHDNNLIIPELYEGEMQDGVRHFELALREGSREFLPGKITPTWGVNSDFLGPTIRARRGETVQFDIRNDLPETSSVHWHGMHLPPEMDGGPHQEIKSGENWLPTWEIAQPTSTLWYHPHPHGETAKHVWKGIAGLFYVDDDIEISLPDEYGIDDIPLVIQDREIDDDGEFSTREDAFGYFGDKILVNGTVGARFEVQRRLTRFRVLNGSNTRWYNLAFSDGRSFRLVGTDGGLCTGEGSDLTSILISPAERAEIVVEFAPGDDVMLTNVSESKWKLVDYGADQDFDVIRFVAGAEIEDSENVQLLPDDVAINEPLDPNRRRYKLSGHSTINDEEMDMNRIDDVVTAGSTEIWEISASNFSSHNFHIHGVSFKVLSVDGADQPIDQYGPKDTVQIPKDSTVTVLVTFAEYTDEKFPFMFHCHILRHEDQGMMGQFLVVEPGREDAVPREIDLSGGHHH